MSPGPGSFVPDGVGLNHKLSERVRRACGNLSEQAYDPGSVWPTSHLALRGKSIHVLIHGAVVVKNVNNSLIATDGGGAGLIAQPNVQ